MAKDEMVLRTQEWLNETYGGRPGYDRIAEDGYTGQGTFHGLIKGLQVELGIYPTSNNFGPTTARNFPNLSKQPYGAEPTNLNYILQGGFWCKGYNPGGFTGNFFGETEDAVKEFQSDVGFISPDGIVDAKLMEALLNTDGYRLSYKGRSSVRIVQQVLNTQYGNYFDYIPTNGVYERQTNTALIYALQVEEGIGDIANGHFGPSTIRECPTLSPGNSTQKLNRLLQFALTVNGVEYETGFGGLYNSAVESAVSKFQGFMTLPVTGIADMPTIKQLLTSNGYTGRPAYACDASTIIDNDKARTLNLYGFNIIGRYLTGNVATATGLRSKAMTHEELSIIFDHNIQVFPIYQDGGYKSEYFVQGQGTKDAYKAIEVANRLGFPYGTTIYFAVDFDAYDFEVTNLIIPYMAEVRKIFNTLELDAGIPVYNVGVYGSRNTCIRCANDPSVKAEFSFVGNMSTGYSGNLGFPMPQNWAFNQFFEKTIGAGEGALGIDKNDYSSLDTGAVSVQPNYSNSNPEYQARLKAFRTIAHELPFLDQKPSLLTTEVQFNQTFNVINTPLVDVDLFTSAQFTIPGNSEDTVVVSVTDGKFQATMKEVLGDSYAELTQERVKSYEKLADNLSASIGNGWIKFTAVPLENEHQITLTVYKDDIAVEGGTTTKLQVDLIFTIKTNPFAPDYGEVLALATGALVLGAFVLVLALTSAAVPGTVAVSAIIAFLLADDDDLNDDNA